MMPVRPKKYNGVSFVGSRTAIDAENVRPIKNLNVSHAAIMPFGFVRDTANPELMYNSERQWFGETVLGTKQYIETLQSHDIQVMIKPQIWISRGVFTGHLELKSETQWKDFENLYEPFILEYAQLAEELNVNLFCIGTELERFIKHRPDFWNELIKKVKEVYTGKLTYAANWDEYQKTPFWKELDYIGVNAYFPLSDAQTPDVETCKIAMEKWKLEMQTFAKSQNKSIIFTEFGYRSVDYTAKQPWRSDRDMTEVNLVAQSNATQAFFESLWNEDWVSGGFIWKWFPNYESSGGSNDSRFTPQNKPVENIIKQFYSGF